MIHYFAYGSNMLIQRLQARCSSARPLGVATLSGFSLDFSKRGQDGSGKATLVASTTPTHEVYGVVFELVVRELPTLDLIKGLGKGYDRPDGLSVKFLSDATRIEIATYIAHPDHRDQELRPYDWYHDLCLTGARQHALPTHHLDHLGTFPPIPDPHHDRPTRQEALAILARV